MKKENNYGFLYIGKYDNLKDLSKSIKFYSEESPSFTIMTDLESKIEKRLTDLNLENEGVDIDQIRASTINIDINQESLKVKKLQRLIMS